MTQMGFVGRLAGRGLAGAVLLTSCVLCLLVDSGPALARQDSRTRATEAERAPARTPDAATGDARGVMYERDLRMSPAEPVYGRVLARERGTGALRYQIFGSRPNDLIGWSLLHVADIDGDGVRDVVVSSPNAALGRGYVGEVALHSGMDGALLWRRGSLTTEVFGIGLADPESAGLTDVEPSVLVRTYSSDPALGDAYGWQLLDLSRGEVIGVGAESELAAGVDWHVPEGTPPPLVAEPITDLNADGVVNADDLNILLGMLGGEGSAASSGDLNADGVVDATDVTVLLQRFGADLSLQGQLGCVGGQGENCCFCWQPGCVGGIFGNQCHGNGEDEEIDDLTNPPAGTPSHCRNDDDGDGLADWKDCDSSCYGGNEEFDCACRDDDGDGVRNQNDCDSSCYAGNPELCEPGIDLLIDSDNDGSLTPGDDEIEEDAPGHVILSTRTLDEDFDGWPDFADGFNLVDPPAPLSFTPDDLLAETSFSPLRLSIRHIQDEDALVTLNYSASDPLGSQVLGGWEPAPGHLRVWRVDAGEPRNTATLDQGGDYIAPGTYTLEELGLTTGSAGVTLFVECVRPSDVSGDQWITASLVSMCCSGEDAVALTGVEVELLGKYLDTSEWRFAPLLVPTTFYDLTDPPEPEVIPAISTPFVHKIRVHDPRSLSGTITIVGTQLALTQQGAYWESEPFWVVPEEVPASPGGIPGPEAGVPVFVPDDEAAWSYNPSGKAKKVKVEKATKSEKLLQKEIDAVVAELEADTTNAWRAGYTSNDSGAYGKEVHKRVGQRLAGKQRWYSSVWFHKDTRTVLSIGTPPTGVPSNQIAELDVIYTKKGKTLAVGDVFDWDKVESVDEIKTTIKGTMPDDQKQKYRAILGNDRFRMQNTTRRFTDAAGWHDNSKGIRSRGIQRMLIGASAVTTILAVSYPAEAEDERDAMLSAYIHLKNNFNHPAEGPAAAYDFGVALSQYLTVTTGEDQSGKIVAICVYAQLYFQDSQPEEDE